MGWDCYILSPGGGYDPYNSAVTHPKIVCRVVAKHLRVVRGLYVHTPYRFADYANDRIAWKARMNEAYGNFVRFWQ